MAEKSGIPIPTDRQEEPTRKVPGRGAAALRLLVEQLEAPVAPVALPGGDLAMNVNLNGG